MDWFQFLSSIAASLAWPVAAVILVHQLRGPLGKLVPLIRSMKYKELQIDLAAKLETVEMEVAATSTPTPSSPDTTGFDALAEMDPRAAISFAWIPVQKEILKMAEKEGINAIDAYSAEALVKLLRDRKVIPVELAEALNELSSLREASAHMDERAVTFLVARRVNRMCIRMIEVLQKLQQGQD